MADELLNEQAHIVVYDPKVMPERVHSDLDYLGTRSPEENRSKVTVVNEPNEAMATVDVVALLTESDEIRTSDWDKIY